MQDFSFFSSDWFAFLDVRGQELVTQSVHLYERELRLNSSFEDYSFLVFPMAKAYEGFLKKYLFSLSILPESQYHHRQFRIGRSLNPDISDKHKNELWLYDDVAHLCSNEVARALWDAWIDCRNHVFHYFTDVEANITLNEAKKLLLQMDSAMSKSLDCAIREKRLITHEGLKTIFDNT